MRVTLTVFEGSNTTAQVELTISVASRHRMAVVQTRLISALAFLASNGGRLAALAFGAGRMGAAGAEEEALGICERAVGGGVGGAAGSALAELGGTLDVAAGEAVTVAACTAVGGSCETGRCIATIRALPSAKAIASSLWPRVA